MPNALLFLVLLIVHLLGDFYLQTPGLAAKKEDAYSGLVFHALIYAGIILLAFAVVDAPWWIFAIAAVAHWLIDSLKWLLRNKHFSKAALFGVDQVLHLLVLVLLAHFSPEAGLRPWLATLGISNTFWAWAALLLLILKPVNVSVDILFEKYALAAKEESSRQDQKKNSTGAENPASEPVVKPLEVEGAGAWVGTLERLITVLFASLGQYAAMGLLMAAKSMARYDKISKGPAFAEYYLIGTLFSLLMAIAAYLVIFKLIAPVPVVPDPTPILIITPTPLP
jgi:hypothetical protein